MREEFIQILDAYKTIGNDDIGLWNVIASIEKRIKIRNEQKLMELTLEFIRIMLANGFEVINGKYIPWGNQDADYVVDRIRTEWLALGRVPNIGDIAYFGLKSYKATG